MSGFKIAGHIIMTFAINKNFGLLGYIPALTSLYVIIIMLTVNILEGISGDDTLNNLAAPAWT